MRLRTLWAALAIPMAMAGGSPLDLVMADTRVVAGVRLDRILASPLGAQIKAQMEQANPGVLSQIQMATGLDVTRDLHEVIIATTASSAKNPPTLVILRGSFHPERFAGLGAFGVRVTRLDGVPVLVGGPKGAMAAFLDESTLVAGDRAQVRAALARRKEGGSAPAAVVSRVREYSERFDAWVVSVGSLPSWKTSGPPAAHAGGLDPRALQGIEQLHGGIRFSPDFELAVELLARTEKEAGEISGAIGMIQAMLRAKVSGAPELSGLEKLTVGVQGRRVMASLALSPEDLQRAMETKKAAVPVAPPPHTIRVQTSATEIRTIVIPNKGR